MQIQLNMRGVLYDGLTRLTETRLAQNTLTYIQQAQTITLPLLLLLLYIYIYTHIIHIVTYYYTLLYILLLLLSCYYYTY